MRKAKRPMHGERQRERRPGAVAMRVVAGVVACFLAVMVPITFVCVEGWWRKLAVLAILQFAWLFGRYALKGNSPSACGNERKGSGCC